ncbi:MAG: HRDC domain-containing protein, partial [Thermoanaerobaculia bacterium]|nr:HRDC domain-containing protein [Thermoanaerobaculia bacterium]
EQIHYAVQDTVHLLPLHETLREELEERERLPWVFEETRRLADPDRFLPPPEESHRKLGGLGHLNRRQLAAARALAAWREREARRRDLPRGFVLRDKALLELSRRLPTRVEELREIRDFHPRSVDRVGPTLLRLLEEVRRRPPHRLPEHEPRLPRSEKVSSVFRKVRATVKERAEHLGVPAPSLASRREIRELLRSVHADEGRNGPPSPFDGWRWAVLGEALDPILDPSR